MDSHNDLLGELAGDAALERADFIRQSAEQLHKFLSHHRDRISSIASLISLRMVGTISILLKSRVWTCRMMTFRPRAGVVRTNLIAATQNSGSTTGLFMTPVPA